MRRRATVWAAGIGIVVCAAAAPTNGQAEGPLPWSRVQTISLWSAVDQGLAEASGRDPRSYRQVELTVASRADRRVIVEYGGSHLRPSRRGSCQRLGLGPPVTADFDDDRVPPATVRLEPGQTRKLLVNTVCLDANRSAPGDQSFQAVPERLPPVREKVLRWWVENPRAPQYCVNSAIWRNADKVVVGEWQDVPAHAETIRKAAVHGGIYYQLRNHELTSLDPDGVRRVLGSQIRQVFPTDGAVYATMPGEDGDMDLWRLAPTGANPWGFVADLDPQWELWDVVPAGGGNLVLVTDTSVRWLERRTRTSKELIALDSPKHVSSRVGGKSGRIYVTAHTPRDEGVALGGGEVENARGQTFALWRIDPKTRECEKVETFWNVSAIRTGPAGVYGLGSTGQLRRLVKDKFKDVQSKAKYRAIVRVGRSHLWLIDERGRLVAASTTTGQRRFKRGVRLDKEMKLDWDPTTDDLAFANRDGFHRISSRDGSVVEVPELESD